MPYFGKTPAETALQADDLETNVVSTSSIIDLNVTTAKLANLNVTTGKLANDSVTGAKLDISLVAGDVIYASGIDTMARLAKGTAAQIFTMNAGATAPEWSDQAPGSGGGLPDIGAFATTLSVEAGDVIDIGVLGGGGGGGGGRASAGSNGRSGGAGAFIFARITINTDGLITGNIPNGGTSGAGGQAGQSGATGGAGQAGTVEFTPDGGSITTIASSGAGTGGSGGGVGPFYGTPGVATLNTNSNWTTTLSSTGGGGDIGTYKERSNFPFEQAGTASYKVGGGGPGGAGNPSGAGEGGQNGGTGFSRVWKRG